MIHYQVPILAHGSSIHLPRYCIMIHYQVPILAHVSSIHLPRYCIMIHYQVPILTHGSSIHLPRYCIMIHYQVPIIAHGSSIHLPRYCIVTHYQVPSLSFNIIWRSEKKTLNIMIKILKKCVLKGFNFVKKIKSMKIRDFFFKNPQNFFLLCFKM